MDTNKEAVKHFGLIGYPINHSLSPELFKEAHPNTLSTYDLIEKPTFQEAFSIFKERYDAVNVTAPYKEPAFLASDEHDSSSSIIEATNLLVKEGNHIKSYNTDVEGVMECISKGIERHLASGNTKGDKISTLIIGAGGAGKAAALASLNMGLPTVILNRSDKKAFEFADRLALTHSFEISAVPFTEIQSAIHNSQIIIYTIPDYIEVLADCDFSEKIIIEANYRNPSISPSFIKKATLYLSGKEWLKAQAEATWKHLSISSY